METVNKSSYLKGEELLLKYLTREPQVKINKKAPLILLLHGVGSNEADLFGLAATLPPEFLVVSARAPYTMNPGSYAWYEVEFSTGKPVINAQQAEKSRHILIQFINQLKEKHDFDDRQVYICGFSQGGIMAYSVGLTRPDKVRGIAVLSGRLPDEIESLTAGPDKLKDLAVFISHGKEDQMLGVHYAAQARKFVESKGIRAVYKEYPAGHSIIPPMLHDLNQWLKISAGNKILTK